MEKPVILAVDDDPQVLRSIARDLRDKYGDEYQILRADSGTTGLQTLDELSESASPVVCFHVISVLLSASRTRGTRLGCPVNVRWTRSWVPPVRCPRSSR